MGEAVWQVFRQVACHNQVMNTVDYERWIPAYDATKYPRRLVYTLANITPPKINALKASS